MILNLTIANTANVFALHAFDIRECPHTSVDYTVMLDVPVLPVPTLIEFWTNELIKQSHLSDKMPLINHLTDYNYDTTAHSIGSSTLMLIEQSVIHYNYINQLQTYHGISSLSSSSLSHVYIHAHA